jgi:hypothetical protein
MRTRVGNKLAALALVLALPVGLGSAFAETPAKPGQEAIDHGAHHPDAAKENTPTPSAEQPATQPGGMKMGMMGQGGMMGGDMTQMMSMMQGMMTMMHAANGMMASHAEERIATLKSELKITDAHSKDWERFADALRANANSMKGMHREMMGPGADATLPERLEGQQKMLAARLDSMKAVKKALEPLYAAFNGDQKKIADKLMVGPMGVM